jgi:hypothetical protein
MHVDFEEWYMSSRHRMLDWVNRPGLALNYIPLFVPANIRHVKISMHHVLIVSLIANSRFSGQNSCVSHLGHRAPPWEMILPNIHSTVAECLFVLPVDEVSQGAQYVD